MPTPSGRETAQEKRDRQSRARYAALAKAADALPEGFAEAEAAALMEAEAAMRASGAPSYNRAERSYGSEVEAYAVSRAVKALTGAKYLGWTMVVELFSGQPNVYKVEAPAPYNF